MRSVMSRVFGTGVFQAHRAEAVRDGKSRPELLRRHALATNAHIAMAVSALGLPFALYDLLHGAMLGFVLCIIGLTAGVLTLALHQRGQFERAAAGQAYAMLLVGFLLAVADPAIVDFGLATALMAPVHASLLARTPVKKRVWVGLVVVVGFAALAAMRVFAWPAGLSDPQGLLAGVAFATSLIVVAHSANRINSGFEVYEKSQINAYRHLIEHVQDAVMRFAADGTLLFASRSSETLLGCHRYELSGGGLVERIHVLDRPAYMTAFSEANQDGQTRRVEIRMRRDDREQPSVAPQFVWVEASLSPVFDNSGTDGRNEVVALFRDITERHDHENEMKMARKAAEEASSAKSRFLATIGHELRTPLNAIVGFSEMMTSGVVGELSAQHKEYATLIHGSGKHLIDVVQMLLDMSRLEAGKFDLQTESLAPDSLIEPCLRMVDGLAREKHVRLASEIGGTLPQVVGDERALRQVLINLLSNAVKFSHEHSVVTVSMRRQGRFLNLSVTDLGIGMGEEAVKRIGEPFFQANDGLSRRYEGTGLGLSIVKGLVDLHDGQLHVISAPGQGTTVTVLLPINGPAIKVEETASITPLHRDPGPQQTPQWHEDGKRRAL